MTGKREHHESIRKEMGFTHHDFYARLPELLHGITYHTERDFTSFPLDGGRVEIRLAPEQARAVGPSMQMTYTIVTLDFFDCKRKQIDDFVRRFTLTFMRGGG